MSSKKKATSTDQGAIKASRVSKVLTPGAGTPRSVGSDDDDFDDDTEVPNELNTVISQNIQKFDISVLSLICFRPVS